jgi:hypothetical protein
MVVGRWSDGSRPSTIGAKNVPSRDYGHLTDGSLFLDGFRILSLDGFRNGWMAAMAALGQTETFHPLSITNSVMRLTRRAAPLPL